MSTNAIMLQILIVCAVFLVFGAIYDRYRKSYFKSKKFAELNRQTDNIAELYEDILYFSDDVKQHFYADFAPMIDEENVGKSTDRYVFLCSNEFMKKLEECPVQTIRDCCGFNNTVGEQERAEDIFKQLEKLEKTFDQFKVECDEALRLVRDSVPAIIRLFDKKRVLMLLAIQPNLRLSDVVPKYVFKNRDSLDEISVVFNADKLSELLH